MTTRTPRSGVGFPARLAPAASASASTLQRPQRPLREAHEQAARRAAAAQSGPAGLGLDSADVRRRMVQRLRAEGITHEAVLRAFDAVPRHRFVDPALVTQAYEDTSLPIGHGQTISKPSVVARMLELLAGGANARASATLGRVLEIGTGCGYQAALLHAMARSVVSVERIAALHERARENVAPLALVNLRLVLGDGLRGHPPNAPYDAIVAAAGGDALPQAWLDQLAVGGRLVAPVLDAATRRQVLVVVDRSAAGLAHRVCEDVLFVPLKSGIVR